MKNKVVMSPRNGQLAVAIPLFRNMEDEEDVSDIEVPNSSYRFKVVAQDSRPLAYVIDGGDKIAGILGAEWVEANLEFLGDL